MAPIESVAESVAEAAGVSSVAMVAQPAASKSGALDPRLADELWRASGAQEWGLDRDECGEILLEVGAEAKFGLSEGETASRREQAAFFESLCLGDLVLARACAGGHEGAWRQFLARFRQPLTRAAVAITGSETLGCELAEQLYAELYGLTEREGERRCPLASYRGRGSLMGWLRTTLAQRHVDHHRRTGRLEPLEDIDAIAPEAAPQTPARELSQVEHAVAEALRACTAEERFLLAAYYLDEQTLLQIARVLGVHEATVSRKLHRATKGTRKEVLRNLQRSGMSRRGAEEALGADPRDIELNLKKLLQPSQTAAFQEQVAR